MGKKIVITGESITDPSAPLLPIVDPIESAGSLYLVDVSHPAEAWDDGVPSDGTIVPNLFGDQLTALGGVGAVDPTINVNGGIGNGTKGVIERSDKGGLHVIVSQANALASGDGVKIVMPAALTDYLVDNPSNDYYLSVWDYMTRINVMDTGAFVVSYATGTSNINIAIASGSATQWNAPSGSAVLGSDLLGNVVGPRRGSIAVDRNTVTTTADMAAGPVWGAAPNTVANSGIGTRNNKWPSFVFYRFYVEDLTVSGRTYAEVDAIDYALYTQHVLTPGGRYYDDSFTAPSTIP